jgi:hypothetical protein
MTKLQRRELDLRLYQAPSGLRPSAPFLLGDISDN